MKPITLHLYEGYVTEPIVERLAIIIANLPDKDYDVTIKDRHRSRTLSQNAIFHAIINDLADETGANPGVLKEEIKDSLGLKVSAVGLDGKVRELNKPTEQYSVEEMSLLVTRLLALCDSLDFDFNHHLKEAPSPDLRPREKK